MLLHEMYRSLPASVRAFLRRYLGAVGHSRSILDGLRAKKVAAGKKRLDRSLGHFVEVVGVQFARNLVDKDCIDFGAGYVPTDSVSMWLLGAKSVTAVDYNAIASFGYLLMAIRSADFRQVERVLGGVEPGYDWRKRLAELRRAASRGSVDQLLQVVPLKYIAPLDVISDPEEMPKYDVLWSTSVLEHISPSALPLLLKEVTRRGRAGAVQIHRIDLRDHLDPVSAPYGFLDPSSGFDAEAQADERGNAMNVAAWESFLERAPDLGLRVSAVTEGRVELLPRDPRSGEPLLDRVADFVTVSNVSLGSSGAVSSDVTEIRRARE